MKLPEQIIYEKQNIDMARLEAVKAEWLPLERGFSPLLFDAASFSWYLTFNVGKRSRRGNHVSKAATANEAIIL